jgi:putative transposase
MRRSGYIEGQIIGALREQKAAAKTADVCRKEEVSEATFYIYGPRVIAEPGGAADSAAIRAIVVRWLAASQV